MSATWSCLAWCSVTCCARRTPMRASARSTPRKAKAAPGVLAVLTGEDWQASGWGDLPVPDGLKRRDGSVFRPPYPALAKDRVRWVGDYVAFVVAETYHQALDAAELIVVDYEPLPAIVSTADASADGAPRVWEDCPDNIGFVQLFGDKAATEAAFAKADHVVKHRFVINRVTAASMEPRGCLGDYNAAEDRYTIYTTLQRVHPFRAELSPVLRGAREPDPRGRRRHRRQLRHEVGGLQRSRAGAAGLEARGPAGEMDVARARNPFSATPRPATTSPTPSSRSTRTATSSPCAPPWSPASAPICRPACPPSPAISARLPASIASPRCMPTSPPCSPTPIRCGPIAATAAPRPPM